MEVEAPTYVTGILDFESGATGNIFTTFDVYHDAHARLEIYGSAGTLTVPDPNFFGGPVRLYRPEDGESREMPLLFDYAENSRGLGLADMGAALRSGREARASHRQTLHVLEVLTAFQRSSDSRAYLPLETRYCRGAAMGNNAVHGVLD